MVEDKNRLRSFSPSSHHSTYRTTHKSTQSIYRRMDRTLKLRPNAFPSAWLVSVASNRWTHSTNSSIKVSVDAANRCIPKRSREDGKNTQKSRQKVRLVAKHFQRIISGNRSFRSAKQHPLAALGRVLLLHHRLPSLISSMLDGHAN